MKLKLNRGPPLIQTLLQSHVMMVVLGVLSAIVAGLAYMYATHPFRWVLGMVAIAWVALVVMVDVAALDLDPRLPSEFLDWLKPWAIFLGLAVLGLGYHLGATFRGARAPAEAGEADPAAADLDAALSEIDARLSQARYDAGAQPVFLLLCRDEALAADLVHASGTSLFATGPAAADAPVHAFATADGLFLSCAGASSWGRPGDGAARLERLLAWIRGLNPESPPLRGIAVLTPLEEAAAPAALQEIGGLRDDLQAIQAGLKVRCPTIAVFRPRDGRSGFGEFAARMPPGLRNNRCGFSIPASPPFDPAAAEKGLRWFARWLQSWSLSLLAEDYPALEGNARLVELNAAVRRDRRALRTFLETAFTTHARGLPVMVRGCYVALCGPAPEDRAFVAGLLKGPRSKMVADAPLTTWGAEVERSERSCRRGALALAAASLGLAAPLWIWLVAPRLRATGPGVSGPLGWLAWVGLGALVLGWAVALLAPWGRRSSRPSKAAETSS